VETRHIGADRNPSRGWRVPNLLDSSEQDNIAYNSSAEDGVSAIGTIIDGDPHPFRNSSQRFDHTEPNVCG